MTFQVITVRPQNKWVQKPPDCSITIKLFQDVMFQPQSNGATIGWMRGQMNEINHLAIYLIFTIFHHIPLNKYNLLIVGKYRFILALSNRKEQKCRKQGRKTLL